MHLGCNVHHREASLFFCTQVGELLLYLHDSRGRSWSGGEPLLRVARLLTQFGAHFRACNTTTMPFEFLCAIFDPPNSTKAVCSSALQDVAGRGTEPTLNWS